MVKQRKKNKRKKCSSKGFTANTAKAGKINVSTAYTFAGSQHLLALRGQLRY